MKRSALGILALCFLAMAAFAQQDSELLKDGHPDSYTVREGDTLWDISNTFLNAPWLWPEIWQANPQVANPHLIFPGDVITLVYVDGHPRLMVQRGRDVKLSPQVRMSSLETAIPAIPLDKINAFLSHSRIIENGELDLAPYVIAGAQEHIITGAGDTLYARGQFTEDEKMYEIFRPGEQFSDPETKELLGRQAIDIGMGKLIKEEQGIGTLELSRSNEEIRNKDRLLPYAESKIQAVFHPSAPAKDIDGVILAVEGGVSQIGAMDIVILNKGAREGLVDGSILAIDTAGETVRDAVTNEMIHLPDARAGLLMVFRTFDKMSYGLILSSNQPLAVMDKVHNP